VTTVYINVQSRTVYGSTYDSAETGTVQTARPKSSITTFNNAKQFYQLAVK